MCNGFEMLTTRACDWTLAVCAVHYVQHHFHRGCSTVSLLKYIQQTIQGHSALEFTLISNPIPVEQYEHWYTCPSDLLGYFNE